MPNCIRWCLKTEKPDRQVFYTLIFKLWVSSDSQTDFEVGQNGFSWRCCQNVFPEQTSNTILSVHCKERSSPRTLWKLRKVGACFLYRKHIAQKVLLWLLRNTRFTTEDTEAVCVGSYEKKQISSLCCLGFEYQVGSSEFAKRWRQVFKTQPWKVGRFSCLLLKHSPLPPLTFCIDKSSEGVDHFYV